ncbi:kinase-like protein, partial [Punctularia strigosozonata HHB-11173 SS5]|uniref:kinase-like protein n=1 Tax=Punctularia strigosozonata (strain HHB-11173) TaxID=741275 RepID=UPI0004416DC2
LRKLCGQTGLLPAGSILSDEIELPMTGPSAAGGFGDVWKARCAGQIVALKTPRAFMRSSDRLSKNLCREAAVWRKLKHANIAKFLGVYRNAVQGIDLAMVSQWHDNGNVNAYLLKRPRVNRLELALDVASGLRYLHTNYLVHGDIKGANVLVDDEGRAQLTDFGLTAVMYESDAIGGLTTASFHDGSSRWMAPELYVGSVRLTPESDVYAFSMLLFEIYAGQPPFHSCRTDAQVFLMVLRGERPVRTVEATLNGLAPQTWGLMEKCWAQRPGDRPNLYDISR